MSTDTRKRLAVPAAQLRRICEPVQAAPAADAAEVIGQESAMASIDLGLKMSAGNYAMSHYNIVVVGSANTGRTAKTLKHVRQCAAGVEKAPPDAICLHDFATPRRPAIIFVPGGKGQLVKLALEVFAKYATKLIPLKVAKARLERQAKLRDMTTKLRSKCAKKIGAYGFAIGENDTSVFLVPLSMSKPGEPMSEEEFNALPDDVKNKLEGEMHDKAKAVLLETEEKIKTLFGTIMGGAAEADAKLACSEVDLHIDTLKKIVAGDEAFGRYLAGIRELAIVFALREKEEGGSGGCEECGGCDHGGGSDDSDEKDDPTEVLNRLCTANLLVDNGGAKNPPVVHATAPSYSQLFGRVNYQIVSADGAIKVDHTMIDGGDMLRANGGYLVFDMADLLRWGGGLAFYKLLKTIRTRKLAIESKGKFVDAEGGVDYRPQEVSIDVKVVVICDQYMAYMLRYVEPEFDNLFRIIAEFDDELKIEEAPAAYAAFVEICRAESKLPEFAPEAVAKLVEYGSRRAGDQRKASAEFGVLKDLVTEAACWAGKAEAAVVGPEHVRQAIDARYDRQALYVRRYQERIDRGIMLLDLEGKKVGQINGLVYGQITPEVAFGSPKRITARAYAGEEKVVLVQREAEISGPSTNTATATIRGYIAGQYGRKKPLGLAVQISFEQCYGGIDGDSATLAETIALISAITDLPVDQSLAITGSMNQWGEAQPIGGANEKIEGHFGALKRRGLLGPGHGVVLPRRNLEDLMLKEEVVEAQNQGLYQVYAVEHLDEALEIFLGRPAKEIHKLVAKKLAQMNGDSSIRDLLNKLFRRNKKTGETAGK